MMRSLVVNCCLEPFRIEPLLKTIEKFSEFTTIQYGNLHVGYQVDKEIDAVVIGGSEARIVNASHRDMFKETVSLIKHLDLPIFSICYGYQLLCWSLGASVASLAEPIIDRFEEVRIVEVDEIFAGFEKYEMVSLAQSHYDYILRESLDQAGFILLADSSSCEVEAIKHKHNPFYGVQFHPELISIQGQRHPEGHKIMENFYRNVVKR
jgi:GMP synthase-like glutamine amidotransferase